MLSRKETFDLGRVTLSDWKMYKSVSFGGVMPKMGNEILKSSGIFFFSSFIFPFLKFPKLRSAF